MDVFSSAKPPWTLADEATCAEMRTLLDSTASWIDEFRDRTSMVWSYNGDKYFSCGNAESLFYWSLQQTTLTRTKDNGNGEVVAGVHVQQIAVGEHHRRRRGWCTHALGWLVDLLAQRTKLGYVYVESVLSDEMRALMEKLCERAVFERRDADS